MFDRISKHATHVDIDIEMQPLDAADAARLHGEIRERALVEARNVILRRIGAENSLRIGLIQTERSPASDEHLVRVLFKLNEAQYDIHVREEAWQEEVIRRIADRVAVDVAQQLTHKLMRDGRL